MEASGQPKVFKPVHLKACIFINEEYEQLRELEEYKGFGDLPDVLKDNKNVMKGLEGLSFDQSNINVVYDVNSKNFLKEMKKIINDIKEAWAR